MLSCRRFRARRCIRRPVSVRSCRSSARMLVYAACTPRAAVPILSCMYADRSPVHVQIQLYAVPVRRASVRASPWVSSKARRRNADSVWLRSRAGAAAYPWSSCTGAADRAAAAGRRSVPPPRVGGQVRAAVSRRHESVPAGAWIVPAPRSMATPHPPIGPLADAFASRLRVWLRSAPGRKPVCAVLRDAGLQAAVAGPPRCPSCRRRRAPTNSGRRPIWRALTHAAGVMEPDRRVGEARRWCTQSASQAAQTTGPVPRRRNRHQSSRPCGVRSRRR